MQKWFAYSWHVFPLGWTDMDLSQGKHKALPINGRNLKDIFDMLVVEEIDSDNE